MLGMREQVVDIPYDMITSIRLDKGVLSSNVIFRAPGLRSTGRLGMIEKLTGNEYGNSEDTVITAIPKDKAQDLVEVIRNGMDRQREVYQQQPHPQQQFQQSPPPTTTTPQHTHVDATSSNNNNPTISIADELAKLAKLKEQGVITESEFVQMKQDLIRRN
jgi:hypothetical protein